MGENVKKIQEALLTMFQDVLDIMKDNNLEYFISAGTALGAARHGGFIPWDDDLDIEMPREDMVKLKSIINVKYSYKYFYQDTESDPEYPIPFDKIRLNDTIFMEQGMEKYNIHHGLFIDIFPIDNAPNNKTLNKISNFNRFRHEVLLRDIRSSNWIKNIIYSMIKGKYSKRTIILNKLNKDIIKYNESPTKYISTYYLTANAKASRLPRHYYYPPREIIFCGLCVTTYNELNKVLEVIYGNYMELPPLSEQKGSHAKYVDLEKGISYNEK